MAAYKPGWESHRNSSPDKPQATPIPSASVPIPVAPLQEISIPDIEVLPSENASANPKVLGVASDLIKPQTAPIHRPNQLPKEIKREIGRLSDEGHTHQYISDKLGVSLNSVADYAHIPKPEVTSKTKHRLGSTLVNASLECVTDFIDTIRANPNAINPMQLAVAGGIFAQRGMEYTNQPSYEPIQDDESLDAMLNDPMASTMGQVRAADMQAARDASPI